MAEERIKRIFESANYFEEYYCGSDIGIFIGTVWVDDIINLQYTLTNNKAPVHGYMSESFDAVARGTYLIQGQFAIAFREVNYLTKVLEKFKTDNKTDVEILESAESLIEKEGSIEGDMDYWEDGQLRRKPIYGQWKNRPDRYGYVDRSFKKGIDRGFDIFVTFGDVSETNRGGTALGINDVHITSQSLILQANAEPIAEVYTFFAKDVNDHSSKFKYYLPEKYYDSTERLSTGSLNLLNQALPSTRIGDIEVNPDGSFGPRVNPEYVSAQRDSEEREIAIESSLTSDQKEYVQMIETKKGVAELLLEDYGREENKTSTQNRTTAENNILKEKKSDLDEAIQDFYDLWDLYQDTYGEDPPISRTISTSN